MSRSTKKKKDKILFFGVRRARRRGSDNEGNNEDRHEADEGDEEVLSPLRQKEAKASHGDGGEIDDEGGGR